MLFRPVFAKIVFDSFGASKETFFLVRINQTDFEFKITEHYIFNRKIC